MSDESGQEGEQAEAKLAAVRDDEIARLTHRLLNDPKIPGLAVIREAIALADSRQGDTPAET